MQVLQERRALRLACMKKKDEKKKECPRRENRRIKEKEKGYWNGIERQQMDGDG